MVELAINEYVSLLSLKKKYFLESPFIHQFYDKTIVGLRCGFEGGVTTSVEFKSIPQKIFGPLILSCSDRFLKDLWYG